MPPRTNRLARALFLAGSLPAAACGGGEESSGIDESEDLGIVATAGDESGGWLEGTRPVGPELAGTRWRWVEAHCTEGPLDLAARGFEQTARVAAAPDGFVVVYDQKYRDACAQTVVQHAVRGEGADQSWKMAEEARISLPPTAECEGRSEPERPGDLRKRGELLEVFVQRSNWCNGFEVRMVYAPLPPGALEPHEVVRHHAAHFNRRDVDGLTGLYAETGSLVDPFTVSSTGGPTRFEGRAKVRAWFEEAFGAVPWSALRLTGVEPGSGDGQLVASFEYMDPRVDRPFPARHHFTIAGGEIFELAIDVPTPPATPEGGATEPGAASGSAAAARDGEGAGAPGAGAARGERGRGRGGRGRATGGGAGSNAAGSNVAGPNVAGPNGAGPNAAGDGASRP